MKNNKFNHNTGKVIGVGFHKTGTTSLGKALEIMGYKVKGVTPRALISILKKNYKKLLKTIDKYDALEDSPWFKIYKELDKQLPGSKFILTIRDEDSWYKSLCLHTDNIRTAQREWIYGRGNGIPKNNKNNTLEVYRKHNQEVLEYFKNRPNDLLVLDLKKDEKWEMLCAFLNKEIPEVPFPHKNNHNENVGKTNISTRFRIFRIRSRNYIKIIYINIMGLNKN